MIRARFTQANIRTRSGALCERSGSAPEPARVGEGFACLVLVSEGTYVAFRYAWTHTLRPMTAIINSDWKTQKGTRTRLSHGCR